MINAPQLAMKNRKGLQTSALCGCYHCTEIFDPKEITEWTDNNETAICPKCHVDSVIPQTELVFNKETLEKLQKYWF